MKRAPRPSRLRDLVAANPERALRHVAVELRARATTEDDVTVARILTAITIALGDGVYGARDIGLLSGKHGPHEWARSILKKHPGADFLLKKQIDAVRDLESSCAALAERTPLEFALAIQTTLIFNINVFGPCKWGRPPLPKTFVHESTAERAAEDAKHPGNVIGPPSEVELYIAHEVARIRNRTNRHLRSPEHVAIAVLVGWGWTRTRARNAFRKVGQ